MKSTALFALGAAAAVIEAERPHLTWLADTFISKGVTPTFGYQEATLYFGIEGAYELNKDQKYLDWYKRQIDAVVLDDGTIKGWNSQYSLDEYRMGNNYLYLYGLTGQQKYKTAASIVRKNLNSHPRGPHGGFWHRQPNFPNQMWLDGIFMADSFYSQWTHLFDNQNTTAWNDIFNQYYLVDSHARNKTSGLLVHGWADGPAPWADPKTGLAPHVWGRAVGWYFMSLVETLQVFPKSHPSYTTLMGYYTWLARALKEAQDPASGGWFQVMDEPYPHVKGNYIESSGSAMFTFGLLKGVSLGYLDKKEFLATGKKAYQGLVNKFISPQQDGTLQFTGTVAECGLGSANATFEYYISVHTNVNDYKGSGPFMRAAYEWETWAKNA
ncbi:Unsaturated rhamnogalacturonyl hydrolase YteR-like protein [Cladobotryum mycophilum]|uniref:Unsaturated rhamnogalacturonyl hydrolase YteR-like protein n=1 Tax=Cladobotryum mycophilum TaxID=491253 RepID=A0ABR0SF57_9HYPO